MKKTWKCHLFILIFAAAVSGQIDSTDVILPIATRPDIAVAEIATINVGVWAFAYFVLDGYWSQISYHSAVWNMRHGFEWDPNVFKTNFFDHPYHGNLYFNAARTNGMSFWESAPFVFGGSMMWELFMESEFPSYNDLVMTTLGGISVGEVMYRFSEQLLDDRARGSERVFRELGAALINPVGGFNRLIRGDMKQYRSFANHIRQPITGTLSVGGRGEWRGSDLDDITTNPTLEMTLHYGSPLHMKDKRKPYDYFTFRFSTSKADTTRNMAITARALLLGKNFQTGKNDQVTHLVGLFQHHDYVNNQIVNFGGATIGGGLMSRFPLRSELTLITAPHVGAVIIGGSNNEYATSSQGLNYNYSWGYKVRLDVMLMHNTFGSLYFDYNYFFYIAIQGAQGTDRIDMLSLEYNVPIWGKFGLGLDYIYYYRNAHYRDFADVQKSFSGLRLLVSYFY